jgi:enoyl-CoA hydratase
MDLATGTDLVSARADRRGVASVTLNNPLRHNALTLEMLRAFPPLLAALDDPSTRAVVVRGAGGAAFCVGANIRELPDSSEGEYARALDAFWGAWATLSKPVIAAIQGYCIGGGLLLALQADIRLCSDDATFSIPAAKLGVGYGVDVVEPVLQAVGAARTSELLFTARTFDAREAYAAGLVNRVVSTSELDRTTQELTDTVAANAPLAVTTAKAAIREARKPPGERDLAGVETLVATCLQSADYLEGQRAFTEKRAPVFAGR